jgi:ferredoxin-NADP reductase
MSETAVADHGSIWHRVADLAGFAPVRVPRARVEAARQETADARTLTLRPGRGWRTHRAGQFVKIGVEVDGRILTRTYSITSPPERDDGRITITVKAMPGGRVSNALAWGVRRGDFVHIGLPQGEFVLPERVPPRIRFVTGGSGITPVMSMLRSFAARGAMPDVEHLHYAKTAGEVIFASELTRMAREHPLYRLTTVATREGGARFDRSSFDGQDRETWACGPEPLLDAVAQHVRSGLHVERFRAKLAAAPSDASGGRVRFGRSKRELDARPTTSLLDVAERAGVQAAHGCRMGICHSCDATMISGCVRDMRSGKHIDEPGARIQICVCAAAGDVEIDL